MKYIKDNFIIYMILFFVIAGFSSCNDDLEYVSEFPDINIDMGEIKSIYY